MDENRIDNPSLYRELESTVFESPEKADEAVGAFWKELYDLRVKHRLPDVLITVRVPLREGDAYVTMHAGNELNAEPMAAFAYGQMTAERQERMAKLISRRLGSRRAK